MGSASPMSHCLTPGPLIHTHITSSLLVQEEHPTPHHLPPLPSAHSLCLSLPCPAHLLPFCPLPPPISSTSPTPNIPESTQEAFSLSPDCCHTEDPSDLAHQDTQLPLHTLPPLLQPLSLEPAVRQVMDQLMNPFTCPTKCSKHRIYFRFLLAIIADALALVILILWMTPQAGPVLHVAGVLLVHADHHEDDDGGLSQLMGPVRKFLKHLIVRSTGLD